MLDLDVREGFKEVILKVVAAVHGGDLRIGQWILVDDEPITTYINCADWWSSLVEQNRAPCAVLPNCTDGYVEVRVRTPC